VNILLKIWYAFVEILYGKSIDEDSSEEHVEEDHESGISLGSNDFAIVFRQDKVEAVVPASQLNQEDWDEEQEETYAQTESTISYVMHCLMRKDWQEEYFEAVDEYLANESEIEAQRRREEFRLIAGGKEEDEEL
jgi:hypothetical protein